MAFPDVSNAAIEEVRQVLESNAARRAQKAEEDLRRRALQSARERLAHPDRYLGDQSDEQGLTLAEVLVVLDKMTEDQS